MLWRGSHRWEKTQWVLSGLTQHTMAWQGHIQFQPPQQPSLSLGWCPMLGLGLPWSLMGWWDGPGCQVQPCRPQGALGTLFALCSPVLLCGRCAPAYTTPGMSSSHLGEKPEKLSALLCIPRDGSLTASQTLTKSISLV